MTGPGLASRPPLLLDLDASVLPVAPDEIRIPLAGWQERIRFGCSQRNMAAFSRHLQALLPHTYGCVFTGSGDFHHLTLPLLEALHQRETFAPDGLDLIVCDNHPDNMRYAFGIHCGSWVSHAAVLPFVRHVHVLGIHSSDITLAHAWENRLKPFWHRKLTYWSIGRRASWLSLLGRKGHGRCFASADALVEEFGSRFSPAQRVYLSMDKDVFREDVVRTNWDQGLFGLGHMEAIITTCRDRLAGADVCGDVSEYVYGSPFKRLLSRLDGQPPLAHEAVSSWQQGQQAVNKALLSLLGCQGHGQA